MYIHNVLHELVELLESWYKLQGIELCIFDGLSSVAYI